MILEYLNYFFLVFALISKREHVSLCTMTLHHIAAIINSMFQILPLCVPIVWKQKCINRYSDQIMYNMSLKYVQYMKDLPVHFPFGFSWSPKDVLCSARHFHSIYAHFILHESFFFHNCHTRTMAWMTR